MSTIKVYWQQKRNAKRRGIPYHLTYEEWFEIWRASGHLHKWGKRKGCYVMARHGDTGAYEVGNVAIITCEENHSVANKGKSKSESHNISVSLAKRGWKPSEETLDRMRAAARQRRARMTDEELSEEGRRRAQARWGVRS